MRPWAGESDRDRGFHAQRGCEVWREPNSLVTQTVKNPPARQETWVRSLEDPLEEGMAAHSSILAGELWPGRASLRRWSLVI